MDSGNSGSLQSSSGGDEEYDSRAASTMFMTALTPPPPGPFPPQMFDPLSNSNYMQLHQNTNPQLLYPNIHWTRPNLMRSDPDSLPNNILQQPVLPTFQPLAVSAPESTNPGGVHTAAARNPKKRSRASRRAPTTVLTTDTTNFRAMVQEFTGIPAAPFSNSSFPRSRLDIFGTRSIALDPPPPPTYIRRPFAQKVQSPGTTPFPASTTTTNHTNSSASSSSTNPINYQIPITQSFQNPLLSSLLQPNQKFIFSGSSAAAKPPQRHAPFEIPSIAEFGLGGHGNHVTASLAGLPNLIPSDQIRAQNDRNADNWRSSNEGEDFQAQMRPVNGNYTFHKNPSSSNFHSNEKGPGPENIAAARGEGTTVESWICSSE